MKVVYHCKGHASFEFSALTAVSIPGCWVGRRSGVMSLCPVLSCSVRFFAEPKLLGCEMTYGPSCNWHEVYFSLLSRSAAQKLRLVRRRTMKRSHGGAPFRSWFSGSSPVNFQSFRLIFPITPDARTQKSSRFSTPFNFHHHLHSGTQIDPTQKLSLKM